MLDHFLLDESIKFGNKTRFVILFLCTISFMILTCNNLAYSMTVICMDDLAQNSSDHWLYSPTHRNALFSAVSVGSLMGTIPFMTFLRYIGMRKTMTLYGMCSGIATILLPIAAENSFYLVFICRIIQGLPLGSLFSSVGAIAGTWSAAHQQGTYLAFLSGYTQLSPIFTMPVAGFLCETNNWRLLYYGQGLITIILYLVFFWFFRNSPSKHQNVSAKELYTITQDKPEIRAGKQPIPYVAVTFHPSIVGVFLTCAGMVFGYMVLLYYGPSYMNKALGFDVRSTGLVTALPYILASGTKFIAGPLYDKSNFLSEKTRILIFAVATQYVMVVCFLILSWATSPIVAQIAYTGAIVASGLNIVGAIKCAQLVARQFVPYVMAILSMNANIITLTIPIIVAIFVPDETNEQWSRLFFWLAILLAVCNGPFLYLAESKPAPWTRPDWKKSVDPS